MNRLIVLLLVAAMLFSHAGCSGREAKSQSEPKQTAREAVDAENGNAAAGPAGTRETGSDSEALKQFHELNSSFDLASLFREVEYNYDVIEQDGATSRANYSFSVLDTKEIDGMKAFNILFKRSGAGAETTIECWVNEKEVLEGSMDGKPCEGYELIILNGVLSSLLVPFAFTTMMEQVVTNTQLRAMLGWDIVEEGTKTIDLGEGSITAHYYDLEARSGEKAYLDVAAVKGKKIIVNYMNSKDGKTYKLSTTRLIPR